MRATNKEIIEWERRQQISIQLQENNLFTSNPTFLISEEGLVAELGQILKCKLQKIMEVENLHWSWEAAAHCEAGNGLLWRRDSSGSSYWQTNGEFLNAVYLK